MIDGRGVPTTVSVLLLPLLAGACSLGEEPIVGPEPRPAPVAERPPASDPSVGRLPVGHLPAGRLLARPVDDPILSAAWLVDPAIDELMRSWVESWRGDGAALDRVLDRMEEHRGTVEAVLRERDLPRALVYLPLAESRYDPRAESRSGAVGLWQLMPPTARGLGLRVGRFEDERTDPLRSTGAALTYLEWLVDRYDSWPLALVGYNAGPGRLDRLLEEHVGPEVRGDEAYLELFPHLHDQARHFVPRFLAVLLVAEGWEEAWWVQDVRRAHAPGGGR